MSSPTNSLKQILASICCCRNIDGIDAHDGAPPSNRNEDNQVGSSSQTESTQQDLQDPTSTSAEPYMIADQEEMNRPEEEDDENIGQQEQQTNTNKTSSPYQAEFITIKEEDDQAVLKEFEHAQQPDEMEWFKKNINPNVVYSWKFDTARDDSANWDESLPAPINDAPLEIITI
ncbi:hypothetical protein BD560DRAFT_433154 [Blakeslea trispora]|nr:hypothetical protein BD560DRAFT_433154 [Blakeslea trispora]